MVWFQYCEHNLRAQLILVKNYNFFSKVFFYVSLISCDGAPELKDEVVGEPEGLEVRVIDGLGQLHGVGLAIRKLPDLRG